MKADDYTKIGGDGRYLPTTHWTLIEQVRSREDDQHQAVIADLLKSYWKPVYCYLRRKGYGNEESKDLTQGFFEEVVLGRELIHRADRTKGRLRTLMLTALDRYLANMHRNETAQKRTPPGKLIHLEHVDGDNLPEVAQDLTCEESFNYAWLSELLDKMLPEVQTDCAGRGMDVHWSLFRDRVLRPIMEDTEPPSLADLCATYGIREATKASNMIFAVKRRFQALLRSYVRESVTCESEVSEEMVELAQFLSKG